MNGPIDKWLSDKYIEYQKPIYRMATKALHCAGDISRDDPDLCIIKGEDGDDYVGNWVEGFGFMYVKFPKSSVRKLTDSEIEEATRYPFGINGRPMWKFSKEDFKED